MRIDLKKIRDCSNEAEVLETAGILLRNCPLDDPPLISDLYVNINNGGQPVLVVLEDMVSGDVHKEFKDRYSWKIQVMRDEWGNLPQPGDIVRRRMQVGMYTKGIGKETPKPVPGTVISAAKTDGSYDEKYVRELQYVVDEKGCITCPFDSAGYFIRRWGVHPETNRPVFVKKEKLEIDPKSEHYQEVFEHQRPKPEISSNLATAPNGMKLHVWYWRYKEIDKETYAKLPKLDIIKEKKRGAA